MIPDGQGGVIMTWLDNRRSGIHPFPGLIDIYAQRADSNGTMLWQGGGLPVRNDLDQTSFDASLHPYTMVTDGSGGAIFGFLGPQGILAQHVFGAGTKAWPGDGKLVCDGSLYLTTYGIQVCSDGVGGILAGWEDNRVSNPGIYGQHIHSDGVAEWDSGGIRIDGAVRTPIVVSDGAGGAIFAWQSSPYGHVFARRIGGNGSFPSGWATGSVDLTPGGFARRLWAAVPDGTGGAVLSWEDMSQDIQGDLRLGRISFDGSVGAGWPAGGILICDALGGVGDVALGLDSSGGIVTTWTDGRDPQAGVKVYAARTLLGGLVTPVEVSGFMAEAQDGLVRLSWQIFETTVPDFRVERREDGASVPYVLPSIPKKSAGGGFTTEDLHVNHGRDYDYELFYLVGPYWRSAGTVHVHTRDSFTSLTTARPNPSRGACIFEIRGTPGTSGSVTILDASGRMVRRLWSGLQDIPNRQLTWDGLGDRGEPQPAGVYFIRYESEGRVVTTRVAHLR